MHREHQGILYGLFAALIVAAMVIFLGLASVAFCQFALTKSYTYAPVTKTSILNYLAVVFSGIGGWIFLSEAPDVFVWIGASIIIISALIAILDKTPPHPLIR